MTDLPADLSTAYRAKYGVDWYECLSDAGTVKGLPARVVLALIIGRMVRLAAAEETDPHEPCSRCCEEHPVNVLEDGLCPACTDAEEDE